MKGIYGLQQSREIKVMSLQRSYHHMGTTIADTQPEFGSTNGNQ